MLEKLFFGCMGFIISFFVLFGVTYKLLWERLSTPTSYADDMESMAVADRCFPWAFFVAIIGSTLAARLAVRFSVLLSRGRPPESFRQGPTPPL